MAQYIPKSTVMAEIEKMVRRLEDAFDNPSFASYEANLIAKGGYRKLKDILSLLDTLEVKEVDLEEECKTYLKNNFTSKEAPDEFLTTLMQLDDMVLFAKHFFELGLKAQKGE